MGSNLGDRVGALAEARTRLSELGDIADASKLYLTRPYGSLNQRDFINCALCLQTELSPLETLRRIKVIEREMGREKKFDWGPRIIDIDIAMWGRRTIEYPDLVIPHSGLAIRDFFLMPILDIAPHAIHPISGKPLNEHLTKIKPADRTILSIIKDDRWQSTST